MADFLLFVVMNGFFFYLVAGYYRLLWNEQTERKILLISAALFFLILLNICCYLVDEKDMLRANLAFGMIVVMMTGGVIIYYVLAYGLERQRSLRERLMQQQMEGMKVQYQLIEQQQAETRRQRHELKNLYLAIESMARKEDTEGILELVQRQRNALGKNQGRCVTGNHVVDAVLNYRMEQEEAEGIPFELKLNIPTTMNVSEAVLSGVLGNALDNAIEASLYLPKEERKVVISMYIDRKNLFIEIVNNFDGTILTDETGKLLTRKDDQKSHGYGLAVMGDLLDSQNGNMQMRWSDRQFQVQFLLYHVM